MLSDNGLGTAFWLHHVTCRAKHSKGSARALSIIYWLDAATVTLWSRQQYLGSRLGCSQEANSPPSQRLINGSTPGAT
jgi:hypothetical protein